MDYGSNGGKKKKSGNATRGKGDILIREKK